MSGAAREDLLAAIRAKCLDCMGSDAGVRRRIGECGSTECGLYPFRPYQTAPKSERRRGSVTQLGFEDIMEEMR